jgi:hypothetical protein
MWPDGSGEGGRRGSPIYPREERTETKTGKLKYCTDMIMFSVVQYSTDNTVATVIFCWQLFSGKVSSTTMAETR